MRENMGLFRGKRLKDGEWIYGSLIVYPDGYCSICSYSGCNDILNKFDVIPETVGEFTGLTDKNGRRIFEGDVVYAYAGECYSGIYETSAALLVKDITDGICVTLGSAEFIEVIGNIHDNPNLLKELGSK